MGWGRNFQSPVIQILNKKYRGKDGRIAGGDFYGPKIRLN